VPLVGLENGKKFKDIQASCRKSSCLIIIYTIDPILNMPGYREALTGIPHDGNDELVELLK